MIRPNAYCWRGGGGGRGIRCSAWWKTPPMSAIPPATGLRSPRGPLSPRGCRIAEEHASKRDRATDLLGWHADDVLVFPEDRDERSRSASSSAVVVCWMSKQALIETASHLIEGDRVREVSDRPVTPGDAVVIEAGGHVALPGLIDAHVHTIGITLDLAGLARIRAYLVAAQAKGTCWKACSCVGSPPSATPVARTGGSRKPSGGIISPDRAVVSGLALAQSGGEGDFRARGEAHVGLPPLSRHAVDYSGCRRRGRHAEGSSAMNSATVPTRSRSWRPAGSASDVPIDRAQFSTDEIGGGR